MNPFLPLPDLAHNTHGALSAQAKAKLPAPNSDFLLEVLGDQKRTDKNSSVFQTTTSISGRSEQALARLASTEVNPHHVKQTLYYLEILKKVLKTSEPGEVEARLTLEEAPKP